MPQGPIYRLKRLLDRRPFRCALCSMGGVGSTALARHVLSIADKTPREHAYSPALYEHEYHLRLGYLFGDPYNAVLSVFRRDYQDMHARAMNAFSGTQPARLKRVSLAEYLERGVDEFRIERQFDNWVANPAPRHPTILIKYEALAGNIDEILAFFGCARPFEVKPRQSTWRSQPEHIRRGLERIYGRLFEKIEGAPGLRVVPGSDTVQASACMRTGVATRNY